MVSPASIHAGFRLFAWLFPPTPLEDVTDLSLRELREKYRIRDRWLNLAGFLVFVGISVGSYLLIDLIANWHYRELIKSPFFVRNHPVLFGVLAGFIGLTSSAAATLAILRLILGRDEFRVYAAYGGKTARPDTPFNIVKAFTWIFLIIAIPLMLVTGLAIDTYTAFSETSIIENKFWTIGQQVVHPYAAVKDIYLARGYHARFEDKWEPSMVVLFADGTRWESSRGAGGSKLSEEWQAIQYASGKAGREIREVDFLDDIPP